MANFYDFLERLQRRPDEQKRRILAGLAAVSAVALGIIWIANLKSEFANQPALFSLEPPAEEQEEESSPADGQPEVRGPLASLGRGFALLLADLREKSAELLSRTTEITAEPTLFGARPVYKLPRVD